MLSVRVSNYGEGEDLLGALLKLGHGAARRLWVKVPWWDTSSSGKALLQTALLAKNRGVDVRVLCRPESSNSALLRELYAAGIDVVSVRYLHEKEFLCDDVLVAHSMNFTRTEIERNQNSGFIHTDPQVVEGSVAGFLAVQDNAAAFQVGEEEWTPTRQLIPEEWMRYLDRYEKLNPLQSMAVPVVLGTGGHVMVVAPTSAGKTLVGEVAALRSILRENKPAVWLLPARALASEVADTARRWEKHGIRSLELTGETNLSSQSVRKAQLWVATTEKFESLYRRSSLSDFIANIGCLII